MSRVPLPAGLFPALEPLFHGDLWSRWAAEGRVFPVEDFRAAVHHVRLKPSSSCRLVVLPPGASHVDDGPPGFILHLFPDGRRARVAFAKHTYRRSVGHAFAAFLAEQHAVVAVPFPNDPRIPGLRQLYVPHRLRALLRELLTDFPQDVWRFKRNAIDKRLLSYKPGERAAYRIDARVRRHDRSEKRTVPLHVKLGAPRSIEDGLRRLEAIRAAAEGLPELRTPRPLGIVRGLGVVAAEWVDGTSLERAISRGDEASRAVGAAGRVLARLHRLRTDLGDAAGFDREASGMRSLGEDLAAVLPDDAQRIRETARALSRRAPGLATTPRGTIHGDFHLGQVLQLPEGPVLVDLDRAGEGPVLLDVSSFLAHLAEVDPGGALAEGFVGEYRAAGGASFEPAALALATTMQMFRRAVVPFRRLLPDWPGALRTRIERVRARLERAA